VYIDLIKGTIQAGGIFFIYLVIHAFVLHFISFCSSRYLFLSWPSQPSVLLVSCLLQLLLNFISPLSLIGVTFMFSDLFLCVFLAIFQFYFACHSLGPFFLHNFHIYTSAISSYVTLGLAFPSSQISL